MAQVPESWGRGRGWTRAPHGGSGGGMAGANPTLGWQHHDGFSKQFGRGEPLWKLQSLEGLSQAVGRGIDFPAGAGTPHVVPVAHGRGNPAASRAHTPHHRMVSPGAYGSLA